MHPRHDELELVLERIGRLDDAARTELEHAAITLRAALASLTAPPHTWADLTKRQRLTLRGALRALGAVLENVELRTSDVRIRAADLAMAYGTVELDALVQRTCRPFELLAKERGIRWQMNVVDTARADVDERKIQHGLLNLLFQAIKFTSAGGHVEITLRLDDVNDELVLDVEDDGPSVSSAEREEIFHRHRHLDRSVFLQTNELGMSLGVARDLLALHGGTLVLAPSRLGGVCFRARIPRHAPHRVRVGAGRAADELLPEKLAQLARRELEEEAALEHLRPELGQRPLVLIVEDSRSVQRVLAQALCQDCTTAAALSGDEGFRRAIDLRPDLILTDVGLPGMDGRSLVRAVRSHPDLSEIPIMVLTANDDPVSQGELWEAGVQDVLRKPFLPLELRARVRNLLAAKRTLDVLNTVAPHHETDPVRAAADVSRHQRELRTALEQVEVARDLAEQASRTKSNFLRMISHELRTPVTAMQLHIHVLRQSGNVTSSPQLSEGLARIQNASQRLLHLVDTALEWARVESNRVSLHIEEIDLVSLAQETVSSLGEVAQRKGIQLVWDATDAVPSNLLRSDRKLVGLVVLDLVSRAVQTTEHGSVHVRAFFDGTHHRVSVRDGAPRLTSRMLEDLFEPLRSVQDLRWQGGMGSGLGLFVVRDLAHAVNADIFLEPWDERGNTLTVQFPSLGPV